MCQLSVKLMFIFTLFIRKICMYLKYNMTHLVSIFGLYTKKNKSNLFYIVCCRYSKVVCFCRNVLLHVFPKILCWRIKSIGENKTLKGRGGLAENKQFNPIIYKGIRHRCYSKKLCYYVIKKGYVFLNY